MVLLEGSSTTFQMTSGTVSGIGGNLTASGKANTHTRTSVDSVHACTHTPTLSWLTSEQLATHEQIHTLVDALNDTGNHCHFSGHFGGIILVSACGNLSNIKYATTYEEGEANGRTTGPWKCDKCLTYTYTLEDLLATAQSLKERVHSLEAQNTKLAECLILLESNNPGPACLQTTVDEPEADQHGEEGTSNSEAPRRGKSELVGKTPELANHKMLVGCEATNG